MAEPVDRSLRAARLRGLTSPGTGPHPHAARHTRPQTPAQEPPDTPQNRQRQGKHARKQLVEGRPDNRRTRHSTGGSRLRRTQAAIEEIHPGIGVQKRFANSCEE